MKKTTRTKHQKQTNTLFSHISGKVHPSHTVWSLCVY